MPSEFPKKAVHGGKILEMKKRFGDSLLDVSASMNPFVPEFTCAYNHDDLAVYPDDSYTELKEKIARTFNRNIEEICVGNGSAEIIRVFCKVTDGKTCRIDMPTFSEYGLSARLAGKTVIQNAKADIRFICNPNNPTGYLYTRKEMNRIRDLVKKHDLFLFSDEVYREFIYTGSPYISACHLEGIEENVVLIDSVSKRYSECGIRIGALITKNKKLRAAVMKFCQARLSPPLLGQIAAEASLDAPREYAIHTYEEYIERRNCLVDELNKIDGVFSPIPMGAFYTIARLPIDDSDKFCEWCLREFEYDGATVMLAPASGFYSEPGLGKDEVRIAYILEKEELKKAIRILGKAIEEYNKIKK